MARNSIDTLKDILLSGTGDRSTSALDNAFQTVSGRPSNNDVLAIGDSITYGGTIPTGISPAFNNGNRTLAHGYMAWAAYLTRQRFNWQPSLNYGIAGDDTINIISRMGDALNNKAATVVLMIGTNDIKADYPLADIQERMRQIWNFIHTVSGRNLKVIVPTPRDAAASLLTTAQKARFVALRKWLLSLRSTSSFTIIDPWKYWVDYASANGGPRSGYTYDGLHPAQTGAYWVGYALALDFGLGYADGYFKYIDVCNRSTIDLYDATNNPTGSLSPNPTMQGTSTNPPTGWNSQAGGGVTAPTFSYVTCTDGIPAVQIAIPAVTVTSNADAWALILNPVSTSNIAIGDTLEAFADIEVDSGMSGISAMSLGLINNSTFTRYLGMDFTTDIQALPMPGIAHAGVMRMPKWTLDAVGYRFGMPLHTINGATSGGTIRVRSIDLRKVI